jgi:glyoxylase-like metal-dependent hydrolase (beta-lactamase superfamily II)
MLTHGHFDHILGTAELADHFGGLPVYMHPADKFTLEKNEYFSRCFGVTMPEAFETTDICEGSVIEVGSLRFEVIETPGHTVGGVCYLERTEKVLFSGDTLFQGSLGRTDLGGDMAVEINSIRTRILTLPPQTKVYPGHGPSTTVEWEQKHNPYVRSR